jgi:hypothetical protein
VNGTDDYVAFRLGGGDLSGTRPGRRVSTRGDAGPARRTVDPDDLLTATWDDGIVVVKEEHHVRAAHDD